MNKAFRLLFVLFFLGSFSYLPAQEHGDKQSTEHEESGDHAYGCGIEDPHNKEFDPGTTAFHHISDANVYSIGPFQIPLPVVLYEKGEGLKTFSTKKFKFDGFGHGDGHMAYNGYVLNGGQLMKVKDSSFPKEQVPVNGFTIKTVEDHGKEHDAAFVCYNDQLYQLDAKSKLDGGMFGGGITSFFDFSPTKNVVAMGLVTLLLSLMFLSIAKTYKKREGKAPKGLQAFIEPIFLFIQEEVTKPFLGAKWEKFQPLLMALFFFILGLNLFGQIPFFGGANVTGNLAVTMVLAIIAFLVTNLNGNKHYWGHTLWMPGVPWIIKVLIITPVEIMGLFIKPLTLMLRLFANITAGHMVIIIFTSLIFIFGKSGANPAAGWGTVLGSGALSLFMMAIELLVAFIQAFVFTILTASYIGAATEEAHAH